MFKIHGFNYVLCLSASVSLNLFFFYLFLSHEPELELTWTKEAALEAEAVASLSCSGHGRAFLDGSIGSDGKPICECYSCYKGPDCSEFSLECPANAESGDPLFLESYWMQHAASSAVVVAGWHRMSYVLSDGSSISIKLKTLIQRLHAIVGNANTTDRFIVFGDGSTQLLNAAVHALSEAGSSHPASVVASVPYYTAYARQTEFFKSDEFGWEGDALKWKTTNDSSTDFVEFVTSPNNPDGQLRQPTLRGPSVKTIHDHAYYWPHFTAIPAPADEDVMLFSISKITGHAGSRFGWALIKDENVYQTMTTYSELNTMGASRDTQLRAFKLLKAVLKDGGNDFFDFGHNRMSDRWLRLNNILSTSNRFSLQKLAPKYCSYFKKITDPSPAYAWLKCEREEEKDCNSVLKAAGIIGREGSFFGAESRYVRLSLLKTPDDFDWLLQRLKALIAEEGPKTI
ncbi:tryptophan aminotransferase-related protein 3-like [Magnolia sinica]|uniref:tryptophan aminotransferase-related protein 3-like n=1 Tax=Magnolia sinica TaxID=86752 RepID=UPI00265B0A92|nr:tryptophan aminotransferase-related protein 3-like [Magnolia sinica]